MTAVQNDAMLSNYDRLYRPERPFTRLAMDLLVERVLSPRLRGRVFAELGISTGIVSVRLAPLADRMVLVDANPEYCAQVRARLAEAAPGLTAEIHCAFFETFDWSRLAGVTDVFLLSMVHVLPGLWPALLGHIRGAVTPGARLHVTMSNRRALNRLLGRDLGLLPTLDAVDAQAAAFDTQYVDAGVFETEAEARGWQVTHREGFLCRPLPLDAMDAFIDRAGMEVLWHMGRALPEAYANSTYLCLEAQA